MIIHNLHICRLTLLPLEAESVLIVDTDTVLTLTISMQCLKPVASWRGQIAQIVCIVEVDKFASSRFLDDRR